MLGAWHPKTTEIRGPGAAWLLSAGHANKLKFGCMGQLLVLGAWHPKTAEIWGPGTFWMLNKLKFRCMVCLKV